MIPDFSGDFINFASTSNSDIIEIIGEGKVEYNEALKKDIYNIQVRKGNKTMTYSPSNIAGKELQAAFGMDDKAWIGQKFTVLHAQGKMLISPIVVVAVPNKVLVAGS